MNSKIFETSSRKLENFLFAHDIQHVSFYKNELDGLTVWQYAVDDYFVHVLREYKIVLSRKKAKRENLLNQSENALEMLEDGRSYTEVEKLTGISKSTLIRAVRKKKMERDEGN